MQSIGNRPTLFPCLPTETPHHRRLSVHGRPQGTLHNTKPAELDPCQSSLEMGGWKRQPFHTGLSAQAEQGEADIDRFQWQSQARNYNSPGFPTTSLFPITGIKCYPFLFGQPHTVTNYEFLRSCQLSRTVFEDGTLPSLGAERWSRRFKIYVYFYIMWCWS